MCIGGSPSAPAAAPPAPAPAPPAPAVAMASAADSSQSDAAKLARLKGRAGLRIDQTAGTTQSAGASSGLNIPN
jgi:hypothetical protein